MRRHKNCEKANTKGSGKSHIISAIRKHGWENFEVKILEEFLQITPEEITARECYWIEKLNSTNPLIGYNLCSGGMSWTGMRHNEES